MHVLEKSPLLITQYNILLQKAIESEFQSIYKLFILQGKYGCALNWLLQTNKIVKDLLWLEVNN